MYFLCTQRHWIAFGPLWVLCLGWPLCGAAVEPSSKDLVNRQHRVVADVWERIEIGGTRAGYGRTRESVWGDGKDTFRQIDSVTRLRLRRLGQLMEATIHLQMTSDASGRMLDFRTEADLGGDPTVSTGHVVGEQLEITTRQGESSTTEQIPWGESDHGFFYERTSLEKKPMAAGEQRRFSSLLPIFHRVAQTELTAGEWTETNVLNDTKELLPIQSRTNLGGQQFEATLWMDRAGRIIRSDEPTLGQSVIRTTKAEALAEENAAPPDLIVGTVIPLKGNVAGLSAATRARYRVKADAAGSDLPFPNVATQTCQAGSEKGEWVLVVRATAKEQVAADRPQRADRQPSRLIEQDDAVVQRLAAEVPVAKTEAALAIALSDKVNAWIEQKDFSAALASAAEVARTRRGDCTEHAVLLAALARARGLPARVVVGLVYVPSLGGFGYHMWNQIWCDGRWLYLDATRAGGKCGVGHIQIAATPLDDASGLMVFLPTLKVMGGTQIEIIALEQD